MVLSVKMIKDLKNLKYHIFLIKHYFFMVILANEIMKILGLLKNR